MATPEERALLQAAAQKYTGKDFGTNGYDQAFEQSGMSATDRIKEILASPEARNYAQQQAQTLYQPQMSQIGIAESQANDSYANLMQALEARQKALPEQVLGQFNRRGLLRSGLAVQGLSTAEGDLNRSITSTQQDRAYKLADLASQRAQLALKQAGYATDFLSGEQDDFAKAQAAQETAATKAEKAAARTGTTSKKTAGGYTASELRKLRAAGIDSSDTQASDDFLYNKISQKDIDAAYATVQPFDTGGANHNIDYNPTDQGDKMLSKMQAQAALSALAQQTGGNKQKAALLFQRVVADQGYQPYGGYSFADLEL